MSIVNKEYTFSVDKFNRPKVLKANDAIGARLIELIMMEPGDDPLHPDMGVGIETYRYKIDSVDALKNRIQSQIETYLPFYQGVNIGIVVNDEKVCNVEIEIGDTTYIYDSTTASKPITLDDL